MIAAPAQAWQTYEPRGGCAALFKCRHPRVLLDGPAGTGKTRAILTKLRLMCEKYPNSRHWIGRNTRKSMTESVLVTLETKVLEPWHPAMVGPRREFRSGYNFPNGSTIVVGGLDSPEKTFSSEYDTFSIFEAIETDQEQFELLIRTLRNGAMPYTQAIMDTNPGTPTHWLNVAANNGYLHRILTRHEDNPRFFDNGQWTEEGVKYIANLDALTGARRERLRFGRWAAAEGAVYPEFDAAVHVIGAMPEGWEKWPKYRAIDFGYNDPFVCLWGAVRDDELYVYRQWYRSGMLVEDHAREIVRLSAGETYAVSAIADHDREDRETLHRHGVPTIPAEKSIEVGLDAVRSRLRKSGNGRPRLFFLRDSLVESDRVLSESRRPTCLLEEFDSYVWKRNKAGDAREEPVDAHNHALDALRYMVMHLEPGGLQVSAGIISTTEDTWDDF